LLSRKRSVSLKEAVNCQQPFTSAVDKIMCMEHWWIIPTGESKELEKKSVSVPICSPQMSQGLACTRKRDSVLRG